MTGDFPSMFTESNPRFGLGYQGYQRPDEDMGSTAGAAGSVVTDEVGSLLEKIKPMAKAVEGVIGSMSLPPPPDAMEIDSVSVSGLIDPSSVPVEHEYSDNRCSPGQPALKCVVSGGSKPVLTNPMPDTGACATMVSQKFCEHLGIPVEKTDLAYTVYVSITGSPFKPVGLASFTVQFGTPD